MGKLSAAAQSVWAKSSPIGGQHLEVESWLPLYRHLDDTAAAAGLIWDLWLADSVKQVVVESVGTEPDARALVVFLAATHDLGKATPAFAMQCDELADRMRASGLSMPRVDERRRQLRHELASAFILIDWLKDRHGWSAGRAWMLAGILAGHHGLPPSDGTIKNGRDAIDLLGSDRWRKVQLELLERQTHNLHGLDLSASAGEMVLSQQAQVLISAIVIMADWIASNQELFPLSVHDPDSTRQARAWELLRLPEPWRPVASKASADALLLDRFGRSGIRSVQEAAVELARTVDVPGLVVIEAPMGEGKTEAALLAAEILGARRGAGGCFLALPTQATSNAMFDRVGDWLTRLPSAGDPHTMHLAHGKAALNERFTGLVDIAGFHDIGREDLAPAGGESTVAVAVHGWFRGRKAGVLANFVVGTIDQLLFAALKSKHLVLRHLAFASKVVVIDEVHAYDVYMSTYLDRVLHWLGGYGVATILLSATLPTARRDELLAAYRRGAGHERIAPSDTNVCYPSLTATDGAGVIQLAPQHSGRTASVRVELEPFDIESLAALIEGRLCDGGCAVVIHNTVARVQETAVFLRARGPDLDVIVAHARYLAVDRAANDRALLARFGPPGDCTSRPERSVVIATQVVEQSLDIDFDLLVTDLAPVDLLLQRMGRLHRHQRGDGESERPEGVREPSCVVLADDWTTQPPDVDGGSRAVYGDHLLWRTAAVLRDLVSADGVIALPSDIPDLVERVYGGDSLGPAGWQTAMSAAADRHHVGEKRRTQEAATFRLGELGRRDLRGWVEAGVGDVEDDRAGQAQVRDGHESLEVIVISDDGRGGYQLPPDIGEHQGMALPVTVAIERWQARLVATCTVRLPTMMCVPERIGGVLADLERTYIPGWQKDPHLAGECVLVLDKDGCAEVGGFHVRYTREVGLEVWRG